jgi:hypothetical protein
MALDENTLITEMRTFMDPLFGGFADYPTSQAAAKQAWADSFQTYIDDLEVTSPATVSPTNSSAIVSGCGAAFKGPLIFDPSGGSTPVTGATEISDAWAAAMTAIALVPGANYLPGQPILSIIPFATVAANQALLKTALLVIFNNINNTALSQITSIAGELHTATVTTVLTTCVYVNLAAPPPALVGPLVFG